MRRALLFFSACFLALATQARSDELRQMCPCRYHASDAKGPSDCSIAENKNFCAIEFNQFPSEAIDLSVTILRDFGIEGQYLAGPLNQSDWEEMDEGDRQLNILARLIIAAQARESLRFEGAMALGQALERGVNFADDSQFFAFLNGPEGSDLELDQSNSFVDLLGDESVRISRGCVSIALAGSVFGELMYKAIWSGSDGRCGQ